MGVQTDSDLVVFLLYYFKPTVLVLLQVLLYDSLPLSSSALTCSHKEIGSFLGRRTTGGTAESLWIV